MRALVALVCLAAAACAKREAQPARAEPSASVTVATPSPEPGAAPPQAATSDAKRQPGEAVLFGTLHRLGTKRCIDHDRSDWDDVHLRAGFVRLAGKTDGLEALRSKPVMLFGSVGATGRPTLPKTSGACPPIQSRSDWIDSPEGILLRRGDSPEIAEFRVRAGQRFDGLSARQEGDQIVVELVNPLDAPLQSVVLTVHYEGCYGKPLTHHEPRELGTLAAGEKKATRVPAQAAATKGSRPDLLHVPVSVQIDGKAPDVYFDLDVSTRELGIEIACPDRKH
jgi:hypothetical protein